MKDFLSSRGGRLLLFAFGLSLAGAGAALLLNGLPAFTLAGSALLSALLCALAGASLSAREFPRHAALGLLAFPALILAAWLGRGLFSRLGGTFAVALLALGLAAAGSIFLGTAGEEPRG